MTDSRATTGAGGGPLGLLLAPVALVLAACAGAGGRGAEPAPRTVDLPEASPVDPRFEAAFASLLAALEAGDTEVARRVLAGILARRPEGATLDLARRYAEVIDGRAVMDACRFSLEVGADPDLPGASRLVLGVDTDLREPARLELPPPLVTRTLSTLDEQGVERWRTDTFLWEAGGSLELPAAGGAVRTVVASEPLPRGAVVAVREHYRVEFRSGWVRFGPKRLPARAFALECRPKEWLAGFLDLGPLGPEALAAFLDDPASFALEDAVFTARLLERVLRVPLDRRGELVEVLAERAPRLGDAAFLRLAPALRWLWESGGERGAQEWRDVLAAALGAGAALPGGTASGQDPRRPRKP